jgi:hypothetical protein
MHFSGVRLTIGQSKGMKAKRWRLTCPVNALVAGQSDTLFRRSAQLFRHRPINPHDLMLAIENGDQVRDAVESVFPQAAFHLERGLALVFLGSLHYGDRALAIGTQRTFLVTTTRLSQLPGYSCFRMT